MIKTKRYRTNILFPKPSIIDGFGSIINIAGNYFEFNFSESGEDTDKKAIENDWGVVGADINEVVIYKKNKKQFQE